MPLSETSLSGISISSTISLPLPEAEFAVFLLPVVKIKQHELSLRVRIAGKDPMEINFPKQIKVVPS